MACGNAQALRVFPSATLQRLGQRRRSDRSGRSAARRLTLDHLQLGARAPLRRGTVLSRARCRGAWGAQTTPYRRHFDDLAAVKHHGVAMPAIMVDTAPWVIETMATPSFCRNSRTSSKI